ncbi:MAG: nucleotidyltransferase domain-containing protein [Nanoarchaeota archaeon]
MAIRNEIERIKQKILPILKENKVIKAGIFGSYARGEQKKESDVDILVEINDNNLGLLGFIRLKNLLEKAIKKKIDLVEYSIIRKELRESILNDEIPILT